MPLEMSLEKLAIRAKMRMIKLFCKLPFVESPLPKDPFGKAVWTTKEKYLEIHLEAISKKDFQVNDFENEYGFSVDEKWFNELALHTQACLKKSELNYNHGKLLYSLLSNYLNNRESNNNLPINIIETGTARGFSSICMSRALIDNKVNGRIITIDCIAHNEKMLWNCIDDIEGPKRRSELLDPWINELSNILFIQGWTEEMIYKLGLNRINFAFLDAQHTEKNVLHEFKYVADRQIKGDIIFFDDVTPDKFPGVCDAIDHIEKNHSYKIRRLPFSKDRSYAIAERI